MLMNTIRNGNTNEYGMKWEQLQMRYEIKMLTNTVRNENADENRE